MTRFIVPLFEPKVLGFLLRFWNQLFYWYLFVGVCIFAHYVLLSHADWFFRIAVMDLRTTWITITVDLLWWIYHIGLIFVDLIMIIIMLIVFTIFIIFIVVGMAVFLISNINILIIIEDFDKFFHQAMIEQKPANIICYTFCRQVVVR